MKASQTKMYRLNFRLQHDSNRQNSVCFHLEGRLHVHVPLRYTKARSLHLACLKTPPTARGFAMIGCRLSSHWKLTFTSLAESFSSIVTRSIQGVPSQGAYNITAPHLVAFYGTLGIRRTYSRLKPPASPLGTNATDIS